jgi:hypothetical protein
MLAALVAVGVWACAPKLNAPNNRLAASQEE